MASVEDRWKSGRQSGRRWRVRWREHGQSRARSFTYKGEADRFAREVDSALDAGTTPAARTNTREEIPLTVADYAARWLTTQPYGPGAQVQREVTMRVHLIPVLGARDLASITPSDVRAWVNELRGATSTKRHRYKVASQMFAAAEDDGLIQRNPFSAKSVRPPRSQKTKVTVWDRDTVAMVEAQLPEPYRILVPLCWGLGLRSGEAFGLSLDDIDFEARVVTVRRQVRLDSSRQRFALPKHEHTREVPLPDYVAERIEEHLDAHPTRAVTLPWASREVAEDGLPHTQRLVVSSREARALNRNYVTAHLWRPAVEASGLPTVRTNGMHVLRHTYASTMLHAGVSINVVSEYLGHSDPGFTLRTYAHLMPDAGVTAREAMDAAMRPHRVPRLAA